MSTTEIPEPPAAMTEQAITPAQPVLVASKATAIHGRPADADRERISAFGRRWVHVTFTDGHTPTETWLRENYVHQPA